MYGRGKGLENGQFYLPTFSTGVSRFKTDFGSDQNLFQIDILSYFKHKKTLEKA